MLIAISASRQSDYQPMSTIKFSSLPNSVSIPSRLSVCGTAARLLVALSLLALLSPSQAEVVEESPRTFITLRFVESPEIAKQECYAFAARFGASGDTYCWTGEGFIPGSAERGAGNFSTVEGGFLQTHLGHFAYCPTGTVYLADKNSCSSGPTMPPILASGSGNGGQCSASSNQPAPPSCGQPINPGNGNMWHVQSDYAASGPGNLRLVRTYNSNPLSFDINVSNLFGPRWTTAYDARLRQETATAKDALAGTCFSRQDGDQVCAVLPPQVSKPIPDAVSVTRSDGKRIFFNRIANNWVPNSDISDRIVPVYDATSTAVTGWIYSVSKSTATENFDAAGKLLSLTASDKTTQRLTYSTAETNDTSASRYPADAPVCSHVQQGAALGAGRLLCVTDSWGRQLNFEYDTDRRVTKMIDPAGESFAYAYNGASAGCPPAGAYDFCFNVDLTAVTFPGEQTRTYQYNEASLINGGAACPGKTPVATGYGHLVHALTGITDENGNRHISWTYDCSGRATSSFLGAGVEKVVLSYGAFDTNGATTTTVTHFAGTSSKPTSTVRQFAYALKLGVPKNTGIDQACAECGPVASRTYDANGNLASTTDWGGVRTTYIHDLIRNLEVKRTEAVGTPEQRIITTAWHATMALPLTIAEPKRITRFTYYPDGLIQTRSEQATTDTTGAQGLAATTTGAARTFAYSYNAYQQIESVDGPRTDVADVTRYGYDSATGSLASIVNPKNQATVMSNFDAHGRPLRITAMNGVITDLEYTIRGWIKSRTVGVGAAAETTTYDYDNAGQVKMITLPGGAQINMTYDTAHRLTGISDKLGNSVVYTLDALGNRVAEQAKDPGGKLVRQITREFDAIGRLSKQTGI